MKYAYFVFLVFSLSTITLADTALPKGKLVARDCGSATSMEPNVLPITLKASTDQASYKMGENLKLYLRADQDALITVIDQGSESGHYRNKVLYEQQPISTDQPLVLPEAGWALPVSGPVGTNTLEIQVFPKILPDHRKNVDKKPIPIINPSPVITCQLTFEVQAPD